MRNFIYSHSLSYRFTLYRSEIYPPQLSPFHKMSFSSNSK